MVATTAKRTRKTTAKLLLAIGTEVYQVRPLEDDPDGLGIHNQLRRPGGRWFKVSDCRWVGTYPDHYPPEHRHYCEACNSGECRHIDALEAVSLI
jgi:hypothetical protein